MAGGFHFWDFTIQRNLLQLFFKFLKPVLTITGYTEILGQLPCGLRIVDISGELMGDIYSKEEKLPSLSQSFKGV